MFAHPYLKKGDCAHSRSKDASPIKMNLTTFEVAQEVLESQLASLLSETLEPFFSFYGNKKS
ncbi:hypothetical protein ABWE86_005161 [Vibrio parahaemolyticus]